MKLYLLLALYTVSIHTTKTIRNLSGKPEEQMYVCTGVLISPTEVLTAGHCMEGAEKTVIYPVWGKKYIAKVEAISSKSDLALLHVNTPKNTVFVSILKDVYITQKVYTVNSGSDYPGTYGEGIVQNITPFDETTKDMIMHSIGIKHGASGSGLFNEKGELVGINALTDPPYSWAVTAKDIRTFIEDTNAAKTH